MYSPPDGSNLILSAQKFILSHKIKISPHEVQECLLTHPHYPSIIAFTDLLDQYNVDNIALKTSCEHLDKMDFPALVHLNENGGKYAIISGIKNGKVIYKDPDKKGEAEDLKDFEKKWTGTIVMAEPSDQSGDPHYTKKIFLELLRKIKLPVAGGLALLLLLLEAFKVPDWSAFILSVIVLSGSAISIVLSAIEVDESGEAAKRYCSSTEKTDCAKVLSSPAANLFGWLSMTDLGLVYFIGTFLSIFCGVFADKLSGALFAIAFLNIAALPYTLYSVYYQYTVVKKWCLLCLAIQVLLWAQFIVLSLTYFRMDIGFDFQATALCFFSFSIPVLHLLAGQKSSMQYKNKYYKILRELKAWKRDPELFEHLLKGQPTFPNIPLTKELLIGNENARLTLLVVINPNCGPCETTLRELISLVKQKPDEFKLLLRFFSNDDDMISLDLISLYTQHSDLFEKALWDWYASQKNYKVWSQLYPPAVTADASSILREHRVWAENAGIKFTPTIFIGERRIPERYGVGDLRFLLK